jgi:hypothetical protein
MVFVTGEHSACMVHLVGCAGHLHEAGDIIDSKCTGNQMLLYYGFLGTCRVLGDKDIGECSTK